MFLPEPDFTCGSRPFYCGLIRRVGGEGFGSVSNGVTRLYIHVVSFTDLTNMCEGLISVNTNTCEKCFGARAPVPVLHDGVS